MARSALAPDWLAEPDDADALPPGVFPASAHRGADGELVLGGVRASELVARHGSPLYVVDEEEFRGRAAHVRHALSTAFEHVGAGVRVYYGGKAFLSASSAAWVAEAGLGVDVCTGGELAVALAAGVDPALIGVHGNNKSDEEIAAAVQAGAGSIVIDNVPEIARIAAAAERAGKVQPVRLRVSNGVHASTHDFLATAHEDQKFGVPLSGAAEVVARIRSQPWLRFLGLHCHIGSQIFGPAGFQESALRLLEVHARLLADGPVPELNLGGGIGIAYTAADRPEPVDELARALASTVGTECARLGIPVPLLCFEPGRYIAGPSGVTLYTVGAVKPVEVAEGVERWYVAVDGGMSDNPRPALYEADYTVRIAGRASRRPPVLVRVVGKHCESGDIVVPADYLPADVQPGDVLAVGATGAYCWSLASNYNHIGRPPVVAVRDGASRVIVRGETLADVLARDCGIEDPEAAAAATGWEKR